MKLIFGVFICTCITFHPIFLLFVYNCMFHFIVILLTVIFLAHTSKGALNIKKFNTILITYNVVQVLPTGNSTNQLSNR